MKLVYIVDFIPMASGICNHLRVFDSLEKAKKHIRSIPGIEETYPGFWNCYYTGKNNENWRNLGSYTIDTREVE